MNREALNMALEALEVANSCIDGYYIPKGKTHLPEIELAITAIKEALADPSPNFNCKSVQARLATAWGYVKAQPEQEPVAWYRDEDGIRIYYETKCWDDAIPLYTAPQPWEKFCDSNCVWTDHHPDCKLAEQHQDWCASLTQMLMSMPPKPAPCNCKPPQRTWVGLTLDERIELAQDVDWAAGAYCEYAEKIESKLKEKNVICKN